MNATDYTSAQYLAAISEAMKASDWEAVVGLMHGLAVVDPASARSILDVIEMTRALDEAAEPTADTGEAAHVVLLTVAAVLGLAIVLLGLLGVAT